MPLTCVFPSLADRHVFVSGGASGIGLAMVSAFARQGSKVSFVDIDADAVSACISATSGQRHPVNGTACDVRDIARYQTTLAAAAQVHGPVDILVNNAASDARHRIETVGPDDWDRHLAVNLKHYFFAAQAVRPGMRDMGRGTIINLGSIVWRFGAPDCIAYSTAKAGVTGMTRSMARELGPEGIRVNCILPGWVMTDRQRRDHVTPEAEAQIDSRQCLRTRIAPDDIAAMALFLASDEARSCTGQDYIVDAGWT
ncbi:MAG: SDR family oxidoreductase [Rubellimicrobium sp.]|nr:SDR family oxidoreductase [Rubellimicrobium sp.]